MVTGIDTAAVKAGASAAIYMYSILSVVLLVFAGVMFYVIFLLYKKGFNVRVTILDNTKGGSLIRDDLRGKYYQERPGEFRFKIFDAKRQKLRYNQESLSPDDFYYDIRQNGKVTKRVFMTYDAEGQLVPMRIGNLKERKLRVAKDGRPVLDEKGRPQYDDKHYIEATVKQVDVAWYYKELDKMQELFDARSAFDKWGWIILTICLVLTLGAFIYCAYKFGSAAASYNSAITAQSRLIEMLWTNSTQSVVIAT